MKATKITLIYKARSDLTAPLDIIISEELPEPPYREGETTNEWLLRSTEQFDEQGAKLEEALHSVLPGGTYDRLLGCMLTRKASHFVISFGKEDNG